MFHTQQYNSLHSSLVLPELVSRDYESHFHLSIRLGFFAKGAFMNH